MSSSRVIVVDTPVSSPGTCCLCGTSGGDGRTFIDFGKQLDWYGAVYFCNFCFMEISEAIGYIPVAKFTQLHNLYKQLQVNYDQLENKYGKLSDAFRAHLGNESDSVSESKSSVVDLVEESSKLLESIASITGRDSKADEPSFIEGSNDVYDATDSNHESTE